MRRKKRDRTKSCQRSRNKRARETSDEQKINRIRNGQCMRQKKNLQTVLEKEVIKDEQKKRMSVSHKPVPLGFAVLPELLVLNGDQFQFHTSRNRGKWGNCFDRSIPLSNEKKNL